MQASPIRKHLWDRELERAPQKTVPNDRFRKHTFWRKKTCIFVCLYICCFLNIKIILCIRVVYIYIHCIYCFWKFMEYTRVLWSRRPVKPIDERTQIYPNMGVSKTRGTPKSSILIGISIINHPFWGSTIFLKTPIYHSAVFQFCCF